MNINTLPLKHGTLIVDHRASPGINEKQAEILRQHGIIPPATNHGVTEVPSKRCGHCGNVVVLNPDRTRERGHCYKGNHFLCDKCATEYKVDGGQCYSIEAKADDYLAGKLNSAANQPITLKG